MDKWGWRRVGTRLEMKRLNILTHQSLETQTHQSTLLKHKRTQRIFWLASVYFGKTQNAKGFEPKANLWPDFSDKGFQFMKKFMGTLLEIFKWGGMGGARIRGWLWLAGNIYGQIADRILPGRYSLTANAWQPGEQHNSPDLAHMCLLLLTWPFKCGTIDTRCAVFGLCVRLCLCFVYCGAPTNSLKMKGGRSRNKKGATGEDMAR